MIPFENDFDGSIEIAILQARLEELKQPLIMAKYASEDEHPLEWRMKSISLIKVIQGKLDLLSKKLKAGLPEQQDESTNMEDIDNIIDLETYHKITPGVPCAVLNCNNIAHAVKLTPIALTELGQTEGLSGEYIAFPLCQNCAKAIEEKYRK